MDKVAYWMGWLQGYMGNPYEYNLTDKAERLQSLWHVGFNAGRIKYLDEQTAVRIPVQGGDEAVTVIVLIAE